MRNAILQADVARPARQFRDADLDGVRGRGMGYYASADDGADIAPIEDFSLPPGAALAARPDRGTVTDVATARRSRTRGSVGGLENGPGRADGDDGRRRPYTIEDVPAHAYPSVLFKARRATTA